MATLAVPVPPVVDRLPASSVPSGGVIEYAIADGAQRRARVQAHDTAGGRVLIAWRREAGIPGLAFGWLPADATVAWIGF